MFRSLHQLYTDMLLYSSRNPNEELDFTGMRQEQAELFHHLPLPKCALSNQLFELQKENFQASI